MTRENRTVEKIDLMALSEYAKIRKKFRKELVEFKKKRRVNIGPYATFYFECFETMLGQIQEMLHIEKGGDEQLKDELNAYNPLVPKGKELVATLMFEIDDPILRADFLGKAGGVEEKIYIEVDDEKLMQDLKKILTGHQLKEKLLQFNFYILIFQKSKLKNLKIIKMKFCLQ